jgi:threonine/homoserine/homoserine lactone efflux protein
MVVTYILTVTLLIATPGPVVALVINTASTAGPRKALSTAIGTNLASLALIALASYIVLTSAAISPVLMGVLGLLGCLFIGYLAFEALAARPDPELIDSRSMHGGLWRGLLLGISNPKDIIFFIAFFPQFIQATPSPEHSLLLLSLLWVVIDFSVLGAYILVTRRLVSHVSQRLISRCSGAALLLVALLGTIYNTRDLLRLLH